MRNRINAKVFAQIGTTPFRVLVNGLPRCFVVGCYPLVYYAKDGAIFCHECAEGSDTSEHILNADVYWEGEDQYCSDCNCALKSAYGDPGY